MVSRVYDDRPAPKRIYCKGKKRRYPTEICGRVIGVNVVATSPNGGIPCPACGHYNRLPVVNPAPAGVS